VLIKSGLKPVEAHRRIAAGLTASGRSDRKGEAVPYRLVGKWCREPEHARDRHVRERVQSWWSDFRADTAGMNIVDRQGKKVTDKEIAGLFADKCWLLAHLRDRSVSGVSEQTSAASK